MGSTCSFTCMCFQGADCFSFFNFGELPHVFVWVLRYMLAYAKAPGLVVKRCEVITQAVLNLIVDKWHWQSCHMLE